MKHIVFVIESLGLGGAEKSLVTLLQNIDYTTYNVDLILFKKEGIFKKLIPDNVNVKYVTMPNLGLIDRLRFKLLKMLYPNYHAAQLFWKIIKNKFDVIDVDYDAAIAYNQGLVTYYTSIFVKSSLKFAWINTDYNKAGYNIHLDLPFYKKYKKVITVSPKAKEVFENALSKTKEQLDITVIKDITDKKIIQVKSNEFIPVEYKSDIINILTVGRLSSHKALHFAIEACSILINKGYNINWFVLGEGQERINLSSLIEKLNLSNSFYLLGSKENPYPYMKMCDIYVQTSIFEGLGLTVIEASYLNKPIVSTNFPTVFEIITDNKTGLIAEMTAKSIALKIEQLLLDKKLGATFSNNLASQDNYDKEETLSRFHSLLND